MEAIYDGDIISCNILLQEVLASYHNLYRFKHEQIHMPASDKV